jgi:hypothetical protein
VISESGTLRIVSAFDAELYLRLLGERELVGGPERHHREISALREAGAALVATGLIDADLGRAVVADYGLVAGVRNGHHQHRRWQRIAGFNPPPAPAVSAEGVLRRIVPVDRRIELAPWIVDVRSVTLWEEGLTINVRMQTTATGSPRNRGMGHSTPDPTVTDDRGTAVPTGFSGGGDDHEWHGQFTGRGPVAVDTRWIEIDGERIDLPDVENPVEVAAETLPTDELPWRYLWHSLGTSDDFHGSDVESAVAVFVAAGAISIDDPRLDELRRVAAQFGHGMGRHGPSSGPGGSQALPQPWRSLRARAGVSGRTGTFLVGAVTPAFAGFTVGIDTIEADEHGFGARVEVTPGGMDHSPFSAALPVGRIAWWAADDRGNAHLGSIHGWSGSPEGERGNIAFSPSLDPKATRLDVLPTALTARGVIRIPLAGAE